MRMAAVFSDRETSAAFIGLLSRQGLNLRWVDRGVEIPGSYWGDPEAGLIGNHLFFHIDTPMHSALHEAAHYVCMSEARRTDLVCDAGGDDAEENAVCYLQILWAEQLPGVGRDRMTADMDAWGYTFRLGSAARWFSEDAQEALQWLIARGIYA